MGTKNIHEKEQGDSLGSNPKDFIDPDKNVISLFDTDILVQVVNGKIDLNKVALLELKNRGLDSNGNWVGFNKD
jgi:hypothetical protein